MASVAIGCSRPGWLRAPKLPDLPELPTVTLPEFGGSEKQAGRVSQVEVADSAEVTEFYVRATEFYWLLEGRRFNSIIAFRDQALRAFFEDEQSFVDYYADLADELAAAHFDRSVPLHTSVDEFAVDGPGRARVSVRIVGADGRPLRFWSTTVRREDRWERRNGQWWVTATKN